MEFGLLGVQGMIDTKIGKRVYHSKNSCSWTVFNNLRIPTNLH
jgi:hypothetical protein